MSLLFERRTASAPPAVATLWEPPPPPAPQGAPPPPSSLDGGAAIHHSRDGGAAIHHSRDGGAAILHAPWKASLLSAPSSVGDPGSLSGLSSSSAISNPSGGAAAAAPEPPPPPPTSPLVALPLPDARLAGGRLVYPFAYSPLVFAPGGGAVRGGGEGAVPEAGPHLWYGAQPGFLPGHQYALPHAGSLETIRASLAATSSHFRAIAAGGVPATALHTEAMLLGAAHAAAAAAASHGGVAATVTGAGRAAPRSTHSFGGGGGAGGGRGPRSGGGGGGGGGGRGSARPGDILPPRTQLMAEFRSNFFQPQGLEDVVGAAFDFACDPCVLSTHTLHTHMPLPSLFFTSQTRPPPPTHTLHTAWGKFSLSSSLRAAQTKAARPTARWCTSSPLPHPRWRWRCTATSR